MHAAQKSFAASPRPRSFVELVRNADGLAAHLVRTYDHEQRPCWFLLEASEQALVRLQRTRYEDMVDLTQYGKIIASGWGHLPDKELLRNF